MALSLSAIKDDQAFDIVVVGAGMVGACATLGLSKLGLNILLIDAFSVSVDPEKYTPSYDARSTAISLGSMGILQGLGVWSEIQKHACPMNSVHVSEQGRFGVTRINAADLEQDALGYVVPNQWLGQCLLSRLSTEQVSLCASTKVTKITQKDKLQILHLNNQNAETKVLTTRLLLIADGTKSETAGLLGIDSTVEKYEQSALIANISTELNHEGRAFERFTKTGPLALLPLSESRSSLVWTLDEGGANKLKNMDETEFCKRLQVTFGDRLGRVERCGERSTYPLQLVRAMEQFRPGLLLLGNAAHSLHPVAGQGFNLALRGVAALLETIGNAERAQVPFEALDVLRAFCESQKLDQSKTILFSDQLVKVFGSHSLLLGLFRDFGLVGLNNIPALKSVFANSAMGLSGKKARFSGLPDLLEG